MAPAGAGVEVRRAVHVLHAAGNQAIGLAGADLGRGRDNRLGTGTTDAVNGHRRHRMRQARVDGRLARRIHLRARLHDLTEDHAVDRGRAHARAPERGADSRGTELRGGDALQRAAVRAERGAHGLTDHDLALAHDAFSS